MQKQLAHCGFAAIVGRPNVGKSTLLNRLIGQKLSITSRKPQTTRSHLFGIRTIKDSQIIYIDTPGFQKKPATVFNKYMNREIYNSLVDVDVVVQVIEALYWSDIDTKIYNIIGKLGCPRILSINKIDRIKNKQELLSFIHELDSEYVFDDFIPLSARTGKNTGLLETTIRDKLPPGVAYYDDDQVTDRGEKYFASEFIREKLTRALGEELPYNISVTIDTFQHDKKILKIHATIWVASDSQKKIVIGKKGQVLKKTGETARKDMESMYGKKVFLETWVKTKTKWTNSSSALKQFGYYD